MLGLGKGPRHGDPETLSPEQVLGTAIDDRTDIWALGILLHEMVVGRRPFSSDAGAATARRRIVSAEVPAIDRPDVPPELAAVIMTCLAKHPDERYQDMAELDAALAPFDVRVARGSSTTIPPLPSLGRVRRPSSPQAAVAFTARTSVTMPAPTFTPSATTGTSTLSMLSAPPAVAPRARHARVLTAGVALALALCGGGIWLAATRGTERASTDSRSVAAAMVPAAPAAPRPTWAPRWRPSSDPRRWRSRSTPTLRTPA